MNDLKFKLTGFVLIFITISLIFQVDFGTQVQYVFNKFEIDTGEMTENTIEKILGHSIDEIFNNGFYTYPLPITIENQISEEKYNKLLNIINLEKDYNAVIIRGYEEDGYITARYSLSTKETINDIISKYKEKLINSGYQEKDNIYIKDHIEISFINKWDCITLIVKGL